YKNEKPDLELINTKKEYRTTIENISGFNIAKNGKWLCYTTDYENKDKEKLKGKKLVLRHLETETEIPVENVIEYELDSLGNTIYYSIISNDNINILYKRELDKDFAPQNAVEKDSNTKYTNLLWDETAKSLYYLSGKIIKDDLTK